MITLARYGLSLLLCLVISLGLGGCSMLGLGDGDRSATSGGEVYYTGSADVPLYDAPGGRIISRLPLYTKVVRNDLQRGYARVRVEATGEDGWVDNAKLVWRLPTQTSTPEVAAPASRPPAAEAPPQSAAPAEPPAPPAAAPEAGSTTGPSSTAPPSGVPGATTVAPSIFSPF